MEQQTVSIIKFCNGKSATYGSKGVIRNYHYRSVPKSGPGIVEIRIIPCSCNACTKNHTLTGIVQLNNHAISQDMGEYTIEITLQLLVLKITGL